MFCIILVEIPDFLDSFRTDICASSIASSKNGSGAKTKNSTNINGLSIKNI